MPESILTVTVVLIIRVSPTPARQPCSHAAAPETGGSDPVARTGVLDIACEIGGPERGKPLILLHGWPDDVRGWRRSADLLQGAGG